MSEMGAIHYDVYNSAAVNFRTYLKRVIEAPIMQTWPQSSLSRYGLATMKFMGYNPYTAQWHKGDASSKLVVVPKESVSKFNMLASPHYEALLKAWEVVNGPLIERQP